MSIWSWIRDDSSAQRRAQEGQQKQNPFEDEKDSLDFLDPSLKSYYNKSRPAVPLSLAPQDIRDAHRKERKSLEKVNDPFQEDPEHGIVRADGAAREKMLKKSLKKAAIENCVELDILVDKCLKSGPFRTFNTCHNERMYVTRCHELQTQALEMLGFSRAIDADQRRRIQGRVDDLFGIAVPDGVVSIQRAEDFKNLVENELGKEQLWRAEL